MTISGPTDAVYLGAGDSVQLDICPGKSWLSACIPAHACMRTGRCRALVLSHSALRLVTEK